MEREPVDASALRAAVGARWGRIDVVDQDESTNATLLLDDGAPDHSVRVAEHQLAGRGRLERSWVSPPRAGLLFSALLRPAVPLHRWGWLPLLTGVALRDALTARTGVQLGLKWPNDLLETSAERKLAGILAQSSGRAVVIGVGLNVTTTADELPVDTATSLALCGAAELDRTVLLAEILDRLDRRIAEWADAGGDAEACGLAADYRQACVTLGRSVAVSTTDGGRVTGRASDVDADGRLRIERDGRVESIGAGDVEHVR